ncbi:MAG: hypothetical protein AYK19_20745 [Theionarchaea archaeon DG-70-1]|nr:MAG: hypothetical protein AYK19_20745 [Theionarchaea archaeon DG-70-1]
MGLILNPDVKLRPDGGRAILFSANQADSIEDPIFRFLYPQHAVMLSLFDGQRDLFEIKEAVAYLFNMDSHTASEGVEILLDLPVNMEKTIRSLIGDASTINPKKARVYNPNSFIVPSDKVDMSDIRCKKPCSLLVLPTMRCVTSCIYCYANREGFQEQPEFGLPLYKRLLREAKECGIETIEFSGGDLFCREDAFDFIECTLAEGMYLNIPTKYPLSRDHVNRLAAMGLSTIQISVDAFSPAIIDKMVARSGYGKKILKTLNFLGEAGIQVRTNTVLTPCNIKDAATLARHLAQMPHTLKSNFTPYGRSLYRHHDDLFCSSNDLHEFETELNKIKEEFPHKNLFMSGSAVDPYSGDADQRASAFWERAMCTANRRGVVVLPNGKVTICEELYLHEEFIIGDLTNQTLMEVWNSPKALELAHPNQSAVPDGPCKGCSDFYRCHEERGRCYRETLKAYGYDKSHWPDPRCPRAPVGNRMA